MTQNCATGGGGGIRTPGRLAPSAVFKTAAINRSATPPRWGYWHFTNYQSMREASEDGVPTAEHPAFYCDVLPAVSCMREEFPWGCRISRDRLLE